MQWMRSRLGRRHGWAIALVCACAAFGWAAVALAAGTGDHGDPTGHDTHHGTGLGSILPVWSIIPFAGILLSIALLPLIAPHFWHHRFPLISLGWALLFAIPFLIAYKGNALYEILHIYIIDYVPFIILLWALFTTAGGVLLRGTLVGRPLTNAALLAIGTAIASWVGTTGAAMILIRPLLRANAQRRYRTHTVVFFIFLVANIGGSLTPLGDPPLLLGFIHGVPFFWTMGLLPEMLVMVVIVLSIYIALDTFYFRREDPSALQITSERQPLRIEGAHNFLFLAGIVVAVLLSGTYKLGDVNLLGVHQGKQNLMRDGFLVLMGLMSLWTTRRQTRKDNGFSWFPIQEVAYLFAGIFMTIIPALAILKAGQDGAFGGLVTAIKSPRDYFWVTGILSSFLDNAPTYLTFLNSALGNFYTGMPELEAIHTLIREKEIYLKAISCGAVFMGANTYIGNAPNFMVRSIAEECGCPMPSFFGFMLKYSIPVLFPAFIVVTVLFFL